MRGQNVIWGRRYLFTILIVFFVTTAESSNDGESKTSNNDHKNFTNDHKLDKWTAPEDIQKNFSYYHSGYDEIGRPVWAVEFGKWKFRDLTLQGPNAAKKFNKYMDQLVHRVIDSVEEKRAKDKRVTGVIFFVDLDEFDMNFISDIEDVDVILGTVTRFRSVIDQYLHRAIVVNVNLMGQGFVGMAQPFLGSAFDRIQVYGTDKKEWVPQVLKQIPKSQFPQWYGGIKDFRPLKVYG